MLVYFSAENFRSIKEEIALDMRTAPRLRRHSHHVARPVSKEKQLSVLKGGVVYGANASGKSNLVKALKFVQNSVLTSHKAQNGIKSEPFKLTETINEESKFYIEFASLDERYGYGFSLDKENVTNEYLYLLSKKKQVCVYERTYDRNSDSYETTSQIDEFIFVKSEDPSEKSKFNEAQISEFLLLIKYTANNSLFISEAIDKNLEKKIPLIRHLVAPMFYFFKYKLTVIFPDTSYAGITRDVREHNDEKPEYAELLNRFDTGVSDVSSEVVAPNSLPDALVEAAEQQLKTRNFLPMEYKGVRYGFEYDESDNLVISKVVTSRKISESKTTTFDLEEESDGTCRLLDLLPAISSRHRSNPDAGKVYIIDEFDRSLHPNISKDLVNLFFNGGTTHDEDQLIVTTHESNLLDNELLRRDEIWFVQKEDDQSSILYSLNDYNERFDKDLRKAYLSGTYGAVPFIMTDYKRD